MGKVGIQTLIIGIATVITLGEGAAALAGGKGASGAGAIAKGEALGAKGGAAAPTPKGGTYKLVDPATGRVRRTGRTKDLKRRELEHRRDPVTKDLQMEVDRHTDSYPAQRGREQQIFDLYPEADLNRKRPIDPKNSMRGYYLHEGGKL